MVQWWLRVAALLSGGIALSYAVVVEDTSEYRAEWSLHVRYKHSVAREVWEQVPSSLLLLQEMF